MIELNVTLAERNSEWIKDDRTDTCVAISGLI